MKYETEITNERINQFLERELGSVLIFDVGSWLRRHDEKRWDQLRLASTGFTNQRNRTVDRAITEENESERAKRIEALRAYYAERDENGNLITPF